MSIRDRFPGLFALATPRELQEKTDAIEWAHAYLALYDNLAWRSTLEKIEKKADEPIPIGPDAVAMAGAIARINGIREVSKMLDSDRKRAQRVLDNLIGEGH